MSTENENQSIQLTEEQENAIILKRYGVAPDQLIKKEEQTVVLTEEAKKEIEDKRKATVLSTSLEQGWFNTEQYNEYQKISAQDKIGIAKQQFIEDHPELGEEAGNVFSEIFSVNEDDEIAEFGTEETKPNLKKKAATKLAETLANEYVNKKYGKIVNAESEYDSLQARKKNSTLVDTAIAEMPDEYEIVVGDQKYNYKVSQEDKEEVRSTFRNDPAFLSKKDVKSEDVKANALLHIQVKNFQNIIEEVVTSALTEAKAKYERGEKGIVPVRGDQKITTDLKTEFLKKKGIEY